MSHLVGARSQEPCCWVFALESTEVYEAILTSRFPRCGRVQDITWFSSRVRVYVWKVSQYPLPGERLHRFVLGELANLKILSLTSQVCFSD